MPEPALNGGAAAGAGTADDRTREAMVAVVSAGGDTDTNGVVAGAVLGARFGGGAIPPRWRDAVVNLRPGRPSMESWADRLLQAGAARNS